ncbi:hypothetical protein D3C77_216610 [compost metagenome]
MQRRRAAIQANLSIKGATGHAKTQRRQTQHAIIEDKVTGEVVERQRLVVHDALATEGHVGVHAPPALGAKLLDRQDLACRLLAGAAAGFLFGVGVGTDQRREVFEQQLIGHQVATELGPRLAGDEGQVAMDITVTDLAVEVFVAKQCATGFMQLGHQVPVGGIRRRIRQGHPRQRIQVAQARAREPQAQIEGAQVARIGQGAGQRDTGIGDLHVGLQRERQARILQRQQAANLAVA